MLIWRGWAKSMVSDLFEVINGGNKLNMYGSHKTTSLFWVKKNNNKFLNFFSFILNPILWVMEARTTMVIALANARGKSLDWTYFVGIIILLLIK